MTPLLILIILTLPKFTLLFIPDDSMFIFVYSYPTDSTHSSITENAFEKIIQNYYSNKFPTGCKFDKTPYQKTLKEILTANWKMDIGIFENRPDFHFDAEKFHQSNENIIIMRKWALENITLNNYPSARRAFGSAIHTIQDFYSHSNWVEMGSGVPNEGLGNKKGFGVPVASPTTRTCTPCYQSDGGCRKNIVVMDKLTSGYYHGKWPISKGQVDENGNGVEKPMGIGKCSHGGPFDTSSIIDANGGINKDTGHILNSPHGYLHHEAAKLAEMTTFHFIKEFREEIGDEEFMKFLGIKQTTCRNRHRRSLSSLVKPKITILSNFDSWTDLQHHTELISSMFKFSQGPFDIPVDITIEEILITLFIEDNPIDNETISSISLITPTGVQHQFKLDFKSALPIYVKIDAPWPGIWKLVVNGTRGPILARIIISALSQWDTVISVMAQTNRMRHMPQQGLRVLEDDETVQAGSVIFVHVMAPVEQANVTQLELRDLDGNGIRSGLLIGQAIVRHGFTRVLFKINVPWETFRICVLGEDERGFKVIRMTKSIYLPEKGIKNGRGKFVWEIVDNRKNETSDNRNIFKITVILCIVSICLIPILGVVLEYFENGRNRDMIIV